MSRSYRSSPRPHADRDSRYPMSGGVHLPQLGDAVVTLDGQMVGQVTGTRPDQFQVELAAGAAWLALNLVYTRSAVGIVTLICVRAGLAQYLKTDD